MKDGDKTTIAEKRRNINVCPEGGGRQNDRSRKEVEDTKVFPGREREREIHDMAEMRRPGR